LEFVVQADNLSIMVKEANKLYDILTKRDFELFKTFCEVLDETGQHHVTRYLSPPVPSSIGT
jgi:hypothetical protein